MSPINPITVKSEAKEPEKDQEETATAGEIVRAVAVLSIATLGIIYRREIGQYFGLIEAPKLPQTNLTVDITHHTNKISTQLFSRIISLPKDIETIPNHVCGGVKKIAEKLCQSPEIANKSSCTAIESLCENTPTYLSKDYIKSLSDAIETLNPKSDTSESFILRITHGNTKYSTILLSDTKSNLSSALRSNLEGLQAFFSHLQDNTKHLNKPPFFPS